jgi:hypothetical protein
VPQGRPTIQFKQPPQRFPSRFTDDVGQFLYPTRNQRFPLGATVVADVPESNIESNIENSVQS